MLTERTTDRIPVAEIEQRLGIGLRDKELLRQAFIDKSAAKRSKGGVNNSMLAYLGDAVVDCAAREYLIRHHPELQAFFYIWRGAVVGNQTFASVVERLGVDQYLVYDPAVVAKFKQKKESLRGELGTLFEAIVAAVYLDQGMDSARELLNRVFLGQLPGLIHETCEKNPTIPLGIVCNHRFRFSPTYRTLKGTPTSTAPFCVVRMNVGSVFSIEGRGPTVSEAKMDAARKALETLKTMP